MSEREPVNHAAPSLQDALVSTRHLRQSGTITDMLLQGIARKRGKPAILQILCLRDTEPDQRQRRLIKAQNKFAGFLHDIDHVKTVETGPAVSNPAEWFSMTSSDITVAKLGTSGFRHFAGTGRHMPNIVNELMRFGSASSLGRMGRITRPEDGITQLIGIADFYRNKFRRGSEHYTYYHELFADRQIVPDFQTIHLGRQPSGVPTIQPYRRAFRDAGKYGVGRVIYNTEGNADSDYTGQPALVSLGKHARANALEDVAEHLYQTFNPTSIAIRRIERDDPAAVTTYVWNAGPEL